VNRIGHRAVSLEPAVLQAVGLALAVAALAQVAQLPLWVVALVLGAIGLRLGLGCAPGRAVLLLLTLLVIGTVLARFHTIAGPAAGGSLLCAMVALKFLEARTRRDAGLLLCLAYFVATSVSLSSQSIAVAVWVLISVAVTTVALTVLAAPVGPPLRLRLRQTATVLVQALPIMLVLFVLFPRIPGPLWQIGQEETARTGLSDAMAPGDITQLTRSSAVALRAAFKGEPPPPAERYWRGPVFWSFDGRTWSKGHSVYPAVAPPRAPARERDYTLILEPHGRKWLFALDAPLEAGGAIARTAGYSLTSDEPIDQVRRFELRSALDYRLEPDLPAPRRRRALRLPPDSAPRARALAQRWRKQIDEPAAIVERAMDYLRSRDFEYTLSPPALGERPVDTFLFQTRSGFCEHFASAFTVLMRAAGLPARVVTGYQGGETNGLGDYMIVRQSDAHAWTEVWLADQGWTRVDPTTAASTARITEGIAGVAGARRSLAPLSREGSDPLKRLALAWDAVNHAWDRFVLGYGAGMQQSLLRRLGFGHVDQWALALITAAAVVLMMAAVASLALRPRRPHDPVERQWQRACRRLARVGIEPDVTEGPTALGARVKRARPDLIPTFMPVVAAYVAARFKPGREQASRSALRRAVRAFRPRRHPQASTAARSAGKRWPRRRQ